MKKWFDYTIEERIKINKDQGFTIDILYPKGTKSRSNWDKMIEETEKNLTNYFSKKQLENHSTIMDISPDKLLKGEK